MRAVWFVLAAVHVLLFATPAVDSLRSWSSTRRLFLSSGPPDSSQLAVEVARLFPRWMRLIPPSASVLLVNGRVQPWPFQLHLPPRPARYLHQFDEAFARLPTSTREGRLGRERYEFLERTEQRLTPERLEAGLDAADYLIVFFVDAEQVAHVASRLTPVEVATGPRGERTGVYRVERP